MIDVRAAARHSAVMQQPHPLIAALLEDRSDALFSRGSARPRLLVLRRVGDRQQQSADQRMLRSRALLTVGLAARMLASSARAGAGVRSRRVTFGAAHRVRRA